MKALPKTILALDVGSKRIGVAVADLQTRLPQPLTTLANDPKLVDRLKHLLDEQQAIGLVVGLPRGLSGQSTEQTHYVEDFVTKLKSLLSVPVYWQDEAVTSTRAHAELQTRRKPYNKEDVDALAATYILEDFLGEKEAERNYEDL